MSAAVEGLLTASQPLILQNDSAEVTIAQEDVEHDSFREPTTTPCVGSTDENGTHILGTEKNERPEMDSREKQIRLWRV